MSNDRYKFRVWCEKSKRYIESVALDNDGKLFYVDDFGDEWYDLIIANNCIIEQCTGLKDKNGKLIFEGDVVKQTYKDGTNLCTEVFYNTELCRWYLRKPYTNLHAVEYMVWDFCGSMADSLEVIGNIHEMEQSKWPNRK